MPGSSGTSGSSPVTNSFPIHITRYEGYSLAFACLAGGRAMPTFVRHSVHRFRLPTAPPPRAACRRCRRRNTAAESAGVSSPVGAMPARPPAKTHEPDQPWKFHGRGGERSAVTSLRGLSTGRGVGYQGMGTRWRTCCAGGSQKMISATGEDQNVPISAVVSPAFSEPPPAPPRIPRSTR